MPVDFESYFDRVFRFAFSLTGDRHLAEDLAQECFLRAIKRETQLKNQSQVKAWLFQILVNLWKDYLKRQRVPTVCDELVQRSAKCEDPLRSQIELEKQQYLIELMQTLPETQRTVLFLKAVEQFSIAEIAGTLGKSENTVKASLSIARKTMRKKLVQAEKFARKESQIKVDTQ